MAFEIERMARTVENIYKLESGKQIVLGQYRKILANWPVKNHQYEVETSFGSTFVIESGSKDNPPLILLHGSVSNSSTWYGDVASFSETYNVYLSTSLVKQDYQQQVDQTTRVVHILNG